jgi:fatty-acyl-CoA synthase
VPVVVVQCNVTNPAEVRLLIQRLDREIREELGITCVIELVPRHTLPRTSSGKLSRAAAREDYLARREQESKAARGDFDKSSHGEHGILPAASVST